MDDQTTPTGDEQTTPTPETPTEEETAM